MMDFRQLLMSYRLAEAGIVPQLMPVRPIIELRRRMAASHKAIATKAEIVA